MVINSRERLLVAWLGLRFAFCAFGQDSTAELKALRVRAEQGDATSQFSLGVRYTSGSGVPQDSREAIKWLLLAAGQGYSLAQHVLGDAYDNGWWLVPKDSKEAVKWYRLAAEQGNATAEAISSTPPSQSTSRIR